MEPTFHPFTKLPAELRLQIWEFAVRPLGKSRAGAHFFSLSNLKTNGDSASKYRLHCNSRIDNCEEDHAYTHCLSAPRLASSGAYSWTSNNPSAYLWDSGMWTACRESHEVIEKHYKEQESRLKLDKNREGEYNVADSKMILAGEMDDICVSANFAQGNSRRHIIVHPNRDLFCLQPLNPCTLEWYPWGPYGTPPVDFCMVNEIHAGLDGFRNLAIEYDSSWNTDDEIDIYLPLQQKGMVGYFSRVLNFMADKGYTYYAGCRIWLIDYNLKRIKGCADDGCADDGKKVKRFYAMDRTFVEVNKWTRDNYTAGSHVSALEFLEKLVDTLPDELGSIEFLLYDENDGEDCITETWHGYPYCMAHSVRVLACEVNVD